MSEYQQLYVELQLGYIVEEAQATRGGIPMADAIELLVEDRIERHLLNPAEAAAVRELAIAKRLTTR